MATPTVTSKHDGEQREQPEQPQQPRPSWWSRLDAQTRAAIIAAVATVIVGVLGFTANILAAAVRPAGGPASAPSPGARPATSAAVDSGSTAAAVTVVSGAPATALVLLECEPPVIKSFTGFTLQAEVCTPASAVGEGHDIWVRATPTGTQSASFTGCRLLVAYKPDPARAAIQRMPAQGCDKLVQSPPVPMAFGFGRVSPGVGVNAWGHLELSLGSSTTPMDFKRERSA